jgi:hypothetical protein
MPDQRPQKFRRGAGLTGLANERHDTRQRTTTLQARGYDKMLKNLFLPPISVLLATLRE